MLTGQGDPFVGKGADPHHISELVAKHENRNLAEERGESRRDFDLGNALKMATNILDSGTSFSTALYLNIVHFNRAIQVESSLLERDSQIRQQGEKIDRLLTECENLTERVAELERRIQEGDDRSSIDTDNDTGSSAMSST